MLLCFLSFMCPVFSVFSVFFVMLHTYRSWKIKNPSTRHFQKRRKSRVWTPHHMRVGNMHEPQTGGDVTKVATEGKTQTLRRLYASGRWTMTEEMKTKLQTTQRRWGWSYRHRDKQVKVGQLRMPGASTSPPTSNPTTPTANRWTTRLSTTTKTSTSTKKEATTQTATLAATKSKKTIQKRSRGSTT